MSSASCICWFSSSTVCCEYLMFHNSRALTSDFITKVLARYCKDSQNARPRVARGDLAFDEMTNLSRCRVTRGSLAIHRRSSPAPSNGAGGDGRKVRVLLHWPPPPSTTSAQREAHSAGLPWTRGAWSRGISYRAILQCAIAEPGALLFLWNTIVSLTPEPRGS